MSRFNSKLVRLKATSATPPYPNRQCFNSKLVRLKGHTALFETRVNGSFNSKLVRLKVNLLASVVLITTFQFQTGSIKRMLFGHE